MASVSNSYRRSTRRCVTVAHSCIEASRASHVVGFGALLDHRHIIVTLPRPTLYLPCLVHCSGNELSEAAAEMRPRCPRDVHRCTVPDGYVWRRALAPRGPHRCVSVNARQHKSHSRAWLPVA